MRSWTPFALISAFWLLCLTGAVVKLARDEQANRELIIQEAENQKTVAEILSLMRGGPR